MALIDYVTSVDSGTNDQSSWNFNSTNIGTDAGRTKVVVVAFAVKGNVGSITGVTLAGSAMSLVSASAVDATTSWAAGDGATLSVWEIDEASFGTSANITVTASENFNAAGISVYRVEDLEVAEVVASSVTAGDVDLDIDVALGDHVTGFVGMQDGDPVTWTGLNEDFDIDIRSSEIYSGATAGNVAAETPRAINANWAGTVEVGYIVIRWDDGGGGGEPPDPPTPGDNDRGCWSRSSGTYTYIPTTSWAAPGTGFAPNEDLNEGGAFGYNDATNTITLPATIPCDGYLFKGMFEYEDTSNGRHTPQGRFVLSSGTGNFVSATTSGFNRDSSEDRSYATFWAFIDGPSASAEIQLQIQRDNDPPTGGIVLSQLCAIPMWYDNIGMYSSNDTNVPGTNTPADITSWTTIVESDTAAIERVTNRVTFKSDNKKALVLGSQYWESSSGTRTQRVHGFAIDGTFRNDSRNYSYIRNSSNNEIGDMFSMLLESGTSDITIDQQAFLGEASGSGLNGLNTHADVNGSTGSALGAHAWVVLDLPSTAEGFYSFNSGQANQSIATGGSRVEMNVTPTAGVEFADAAAFTRADDNGMNAEKDMKLLVGGALNGGYASISGSRSTCYMAMTLDGVDQILTKAGDYGRGSQGGQSCYAIGMSTIGTLDITSGQDLGVSGGKISGGEGGPVSVAGGGASLWALNLDSIVPVSATSTVISVWDGSAWVTKPLKWYNGTSFVEKPLKRYTGSAFV